MREPRLSRRELMGLLAGAGGLLLVGPIEVLAPGGAPARTRVQAARLGVQFPHSYSVRVVGERYLQSQPEEADPPRLLREIGSSRELEARIRDDFRHGRTTRLEEWVLSVTEARLCALVALVAA